jgi:predicted Zn-dependent protease with MMP-like domain
MTAPAPITRRERDRFDALLEDAIESLPPRVRALIDEVPIVVIDEPSPEMVRQLIVDGVLEPGADGLDLCGLHTGIGITERTIEDPTGFGSLDSTGAPEQIHLFRRGIIDLAGGWNEPDADDIVYEEIRITILHEIGHHFGLDEDDLDRLGFA